jgi:hypothetical protein
MYQAASFSVCYDMSHVARTLEPGRAEASIQKGIDGSTRSLT